MQRNDKLKCASRQLAEQVYKQPRLQGLIQAIDIACLSDKAGSNRSKRIFISVSGIHIPGSPLINGDLSPCGSLASACQNWFSEP